MCQHISTIPGAATQYTQLVLIEVPCFFFFSRLCIMYFNCIIAYFSRIGDTKIDLIEFARKIFASLFGQLVTQLKKAKLSLLCAFIGFAPQIRLTNDNNSIIARTE